MNNLMDAFEKKQIDRLTGKKRIPAFRPGDTLKVTVKIKEGDKARLQSFEGVCISRKNNSVNSKFTVRKISHGEGVERIFSLFSPNIEKIEVIRKGDVRRAKLYYLRSRTGKSARISDKDRGDELDQFELIDEVKDQNSNNENNTSEVKVVKEENTKEEINLENNKKETEAPKEDDDKKKEDDTQVENSKIADTADNEAEKKSDEQQS